MTGREVAQALFDYDRRLARDLLERICEELGGPNARGDADVEEMHAYLTNARGAGGDDDPAKTTEEWKRGFGHAERAQGLGIALAELLR